MTLRESITDVLLTAGLLIGSARREDSEFGLRETMAIGVLDQAVQDYLAIVDEHVDRLPAARKLRDAILYVHKKVGAPGDWGYDTMQGDSLARLYRSNGPLTRAISEAT